MIRAAHVEDVPLLASIERAAGTAFRSIPGMAAIADDAPLPDTQLLAYQRAGRAWVATEVGDRPIAYLLLDLVDDCAHIEQVSVQPDHAHQGLGRALIDTASAWAQVRELRTLTLTTFTEVPWNAPYYHRLGFRAIPPSSLTPGLCRIREHEAAIGLDAWPRVAMRRSIGAS